MTATKILWGQIVVVFAIVLVTTWGATQWTAWRLGFQPQLGPPWFSIADVPIYLPPVFFLWWYHYDAYAPRIFIEGGCNCGLRRLCIDRHCDRHVGVAGAGSQGYHHLRLGALGDEE